MTMQAKDGCHALTEKEKQTLRLIVRGHDAKSIAQNLNLSVHTINERLRDARRKMAVSSSREAARLLFEVEGAAAAPDPENQGDDEIGEDRRAMPADQGIAPIGGAGRAVRRPWIITGAIIMTFALGLLALLGLPQIDSNPSQAPAASDAIVDPQAEAFARRWLELVDRGRWDDSYAETGSAFRKLNTAKVWADTSERVRVPLGAVVSRTFASQQDLPAPPAGYRVVKFRTRFANRNEAIETVSLEREQGSWRVVGVTIG
jgi:DNA-binding CsgD family transcriptional regulator